MLLNPLDIFDHDIRIRSDFIEEANIMFLTFPMLDIDDPKENYVFSLAADMIATLNADFVEEYDDPEKGYGIFIEKTCRLTAMNQDHKTPIDMKLTIPISDYETREIKYSINVYRIVVDLDRIIGDVNESMTRISDRLAYFLGCTVVMNTQILGVLTKYNIDGSIYYTQSIDHDNPIYDVLDYIYSCDAPIYNKPGEPESKEEYAGYRDMRQDIKIIMDNHFNNIGIQDQIWLFAYFPLYVANRYYDILDKEVEEYGLKYNPVADFLNIDNEKKEKESSVIDLVNFITNEEG